jgi:predicted ATPase
MMRIIAEYAADAALRTQVIFTTHSAAFLDGFGKDNPPTTSVTELVDGETKINVVDPDMLVRWLNDYSLGELYRSNELEQMPGKKAEPEPVL